jgi:uncharacterized protein
VGLKAPCAHHGRDNAKTYNLTIAPAPSRGHPTPDTLKLQPDRADGVNAITRHDASSIWVGNTPFTHSVLVPWQGSVLAWAPRSVQELQAVHFEQALALQPELLIFGSGTRLQFISPALYRRLIERRIGVETMDTAAACRTYNVLAGEGRTVLAALIIEVPG